MTGRILVGTRIAVNLNKGRTAKVRCRKEGRISGTETTLQESKGEFNPNGKPRSAILVLHETTEPSRRSVDFSQQVYHVLAPCNEVSIS